MTPADYQRARRILLDRDPVLAALIRRHGPCGLAAAQRSDHFSALVRAITGQQLSTKAATTIYGRTVALMCDSAEGAPTVQGFARVTDDELRSAGMSRQKTAYLRDLCHRISAGTLDLPALDVLSDEDVIDALVKVKGIGRWSAEMFLIFRLHRPDVLPVGDLGIVVAVQRAYRLRTRPKPERLRKIGEAWRPYRSVASWYLWRSLENDPVQASVPAKASKKA